LGGRYSWAKPMRLYDVVPRASGEHPHPHPRPAIAAAALAKLVPLGGNRYRGTAARTVAALADNHSTATARSSTAATTASRTSPPATYFIWGDHFLLETALALNDALDPTDL